jgi:hypothetical protein
MIVQGIIDGAIVLIRNVAKVVVETSSWGCSSTTKQYTTAYNSIYIYIKQL